MNLQNFVEEARKQMHQAEDSLKYYALSGGKDLAEYARLLDVVESTTREFFELKPLKTALRFPVTDGGLK